jgi:tellurite resistance protein
VDATHVAIAKADGTIETVEAKNIINGSKLLICPLSKLIKKE